MTLLRISTTGWSFIVHAEEERSIKALELQLLEANIL
jgi:hypothetical protein